MSKDITVIDTIVKYSRECIGMRFIRGHLKNSLLLIKSLPSPFILPSGDNLKTVLEELDLRINEREEDVRKNLTKLFEGKDFGYDKDNKSSLSIEELKDGYIVLSEVSKRDPQTNKVLSSKPEEYIILLKPLKGPKLSFEAGVLYKRIDVIINANIRSIRSSRSGAKVKISDDFLDIIIKRKRAYEYF